MFKIFTVIKMYLMNNMWDWVKTVTNLTVNKLCNIILLMNW